MLLVDGLCRREEEIAASTYAALDEVPISGASAGDNLNFDTTQIFLNGRVLEDSALIVLGASSIRSKRNRRPSNIPGSSGRTWPR